MDSPWDQAWRSGDKGVKLEEGRACLLAAGIDRWPSVGTLVMESVPLQEEAREQTQWEFGGHLQLEKDLH